jgi:transcriptional regulator with XRE-family HTH domain
MNTNNPKRPNGFDKELGERIRAVRKKNKMSQETLGKHLGVSFQQVQKYENGSNRITADRLVKIARTFGVSVNHFVNEVEPGVPAKTIDGIRADFGLALKHINAVAEGLGLKVEPRARA